VTTKAIVRTTRRRRRSTFGIDVLRDHASGAHRGRVVGRELELLPGAIEPAANGAVRPRFVVPEAQVAQRVLAVLLQPPLAAIANVVVDELLARHAQQQRRRSRQAERCAQMLVCLIVDRFFVHLMHR
jgi:hypothetical protein